jgi:hypothetical protein
MRTFLPEAHETRSPPTGGATSGGWIGLAATILSAVGYALQTLFDHLPVPAHVAELAFFGAL